MKTIALFAVASVVAASVVAAPQSMVQDDYVWQDRFDKTIAIAESGDADAQYSIGEMYEKGSGIAIDLKRAFSWYERAAKQNHQKAQFKVAYMLYRGEGTPINPRKAFDAMQTLADQGYVRAQYYLGLMLETGTLAEPNFSDAQKWYKRAAAGGDSPAVDALEELRAHIATENEIEPAKPSAPPAKAIAEKKKAEKPAPRTVQKQVAPKQATAAAAPPTPPAPVVAQAPKVTPEDSVSALIAESARGSNSGPIQDPTEKVIPNPEAGSDTASATVASIQPAIQIMPATRSLISNGNWMMQNNLPAEFLPSKVTDCENATAGGIECLSKELTSNVGNSQIVYQTRATISGIQATGEFRITYRNNVLRIIRDPNHRGNAPYGGPSINLGWQDTEHRLDCKLDGSQTVNCIKNQMQKMTLKSQTAL